MKKRILTLFTALAVIFAFIPAVSAGAAIYHVTTDEAVEWVMSKIGEVVGRGQCVDLGIAYTSHFFDTTLPGSPKDYPTIELPAGWERLEYYPGFVPAPGDIAVWLPGAYSWGSVFNTGHTGIIISSAETSFDVVEQNWNGDLSAQIYTKPNNSLWGIIRPPFVGTEGYNTLLELSGINSASEWARAGVAAAIEKGFVPAGIQNNYTDIITRREFCLMAVQWVEYATGKSIDTLLADRGKTRDPSAFTDTSDPYILAAFALGVTSGVGGGLFDPNGQFNREQAATMIMNTCRAIGANVSSPPESGFSDMGSAASWAADGINFVRANGIMQGTGGNKFSPKAPYTKEQSIITFNNINHGVFLK